jgi:HPr kinase/phosphorylase
MPPKAPRSDSETCLHATTVAFQGCAVLILGRAGAGKSSLALQLMALGAQLVADDQTVVQRREEHLIASAPDTIRGQIEARGIGILAAPAAPPTPLRLIVDLDAEEDSRLPPAQTRSVLGISLPLIKKIAAPHFPAAILLYLQGERIA